MNKIAAILLFAICAAILIGFNFTSTTYWYTLDIVIIIVSVWSGLLLLKQNTGTPEK